MELKMGLHVRKPIRIWDDDNTPFDKLEDADHLAEFWYPEHVIVHTKDGDKYCKADRSNAMQPDGAYFYFFTETTEPIE
jgi:hypothetical protein